MQKLCSFIGHREIKNRDLVEVKLYSLVEKLVLEGVKGFIFGSNSQFDDLAYEVVSNLRKTYDHIKVYNFCCGNEKPLERRHFDKIHFPERCVKAGRKLYIERNKAMIDCSEIVVFYFESDYIPHSQTASGTKIAYDYAKQSNKVVFNLYKQSISSQIFKS